MDYARSLNQKVNFYISAVFIFLFGFVLTTSIVNAINSDASGLQNLISPTELFQ